MNARAGEDHSARLVRGARCPDSKIRLLARLTNIAWFYQYIRPTFGLESPAMLSQRTKYALKALIALARSDPGETLMIADIAAQETIPRKFLEMILVDLKRLGFVYSRRGRSGGYALAKSAEEITFGQVIRSVEGPLALLPCVSKSGYRRCADCASERSCPLHLVFAQVRDATALIMDGRTIADALTRGTATRRKKVRA